MRANNMFLKKLSAIALAAGVLITSLAVGVQPASAAAKLKVSEKKYEKTYKLEDGTVYYELSFAYPVVSGTKAADKINQEITKQRNAWIRSAKKHETEYKDIYQEYLDYLETSGDEARTWTHSDEVTYEVKTNDGTYFSVLISGYEYTGGAHGMPYRIAMTFDAKTGAKLTAAKILGTTATKLNAKVRNLYLKKYDKQNADVKKGVKDAEIDFYGEGAKGRAALKESLKPMKFNSAFYVKNGKLVFYVYPYKLGPYAAGFIETSATIK